MEGFRLIVNDLLLFTSTALVFSITCLCILLQVKARDKYPRGLLTILVPLSLQMGINSFVTYANRVLPPRILAGSNYGMFALMITLSSILLTSYLLYSLSHFLVNLLPVEGKDKKLGARVINAISVVFFMSSLYFIIAASGGDWIAAMNITLDYHFSSGSFIYFIHGLVTLLYIKKKFFEIHNLSEREEEVSRLLIKGETNIEIGEKLFISVNTVKSHIKNIYKKLDVSNRIQLIHLIQENGNN